MAETWRRRSKPIELAQSNLSFRETTRYQTKMNKQSQIGNLLELFELFY